MTVFDEKDSRIVLLDPSRTARCIVTEHLSFNCEPLIYEQGTFELSASNRAKVWTLTYGGSTAAAVEWANWSIDYWHRGTKQFSGPIVGGSLVSDTETGPGVNPIGFANLKCVSWLQWFLGRKVIETSDGGNWSRVATPWDDIARELVAEQLEAGSVLTPALYPGGATRSDLGPFTFTVEANAGDASNGDVSFQTGKPLLDTFLELCSMPADLDADGLYPRIVETSPGTFQLQIETGRGGAGRQIGADLTGSIILSQNMGTITRTKYDFDHLAKIAVAGVSGTGRNTSRKRSYVMQSEVYDIFGAVEDQLDLPNATLAADRTNEARRILHESGLLNTRTLEFEVREKSGQYFGPDIELRDSIKIGEVLTGQVFAEMIVGAKIGAASPEPPGIRYIMGTLPRNSTREAQRSGGGGRGGGRRGGGTPRDSDGQSEVDPDTIDAWDHIHVQLGTTTLQADEVADHLVMTGENTSDFVHIQTMGADAGTGADTNEHVMDLVYAILFSPPIAATHYIKFRLTNGNTFCAIGFVQSGADTPTFPSV